MTSLLVTTVGVLGDWSYLVEAAILFALVVAIPLAVAIETAMMKRRVREKARSR